MNIDQIRTKKFAKVMNDENKLHLNSACFLINTTYNRSNSQKLMRILKDWEVFVYFILSRPNEEQWKRLRNEIGQYDDLVITDLEESYDNLVYKV